MVHPRNQEIAGLFAEMATLLKLEDGSPNSFRVRAYESASRSLEAMPDPVDEMDEKQLVALKGVGKSTASKITEFLDSGTIAKLEQLRSNYPPEFRELVRVPGIGPKTAVLLRDQLGVANVDDLRAALAAEQVRELPGLGAKSEEKIARSLDRLGLTGKDRRTPIINAMGLAGRLVAELAQLPEVKEIEYCGSLRRFRETVADIDLLVASDDPEPIAERMVGLSAVKEVLGSGSTKTSVVTHAGIQVDLRVVAPSEFGAALMYFTGSKAHNIRLRQLAIDRGWLLNEYALADAETEKVVAAETEAAIFDALGLPFIPPPMREDTGEIEDGLSGKLADVVTVRDIKGDLHVHTDMSGDGEHSMKAMLDVAVNRKLQYVAITDHAEDLAINGSTREEMLAQRAYIESIRDEYPKLTILHGAELNIGADGSVDYDAEFLAGYDWCVASVHSHFELSQEEQTVRILTAMANPSVNVIGHLTGRRIGKRPGIEIDIDAVLEGAELTGTAIEINSHLDRLDASAEVLRMAMARDVTFVISTDSHRTSELAQVEWGVRNAQRGWVTKDRVANTWPRRKFLKWAETQRNRA